MKIRRIVFIPLLFALFGLLLGSTLLWEIFVFSVFVLILGYLWIRLSLRGIQIGTRSLPESILTGEWFDETVTIRNNSRLPKFGLSITQETEITQNNETWANTISSHASTEWRTRIFCRHRGKYTLGRFNVSVSDPFGLITLNRTFGTPKEIIVYPATVDIPMFQPEYSAGPEYYSKQRLMTRTSATISRVREYTEGDTLNHIHWPSTAHKGSLMVKVFEPELIKYYSGDVWLVLDMQQSSHVLTGPDASEETGIVITSSILRKYLASDKKTGLLTFGDRRHIFPPDMTTDHMISLQRSLAVLKAEGTMPLNTLLTNEIQRFEQDSTVIIVTTSGGNIDPNTIAAIKNQECMVIVIILDTSTWGVTGKPVTQRNALASAGAQVYTVAKNQDINQALDSHRLSSGTFISME